MKSAQHCRPQGFRPKPVPGRQGLLIRVQSHRDEVRVQDWLMWASGLFAEHITRAQVERSALLLILGMQGGLEIARLPH